MASEQGDAPGRRISAEQSELLLGQLHSGVAGHVPLNEIFDALADDLTDRRLQSVARNLAAQLAQGADLASAVGSIAHAMPTRLSRALSLGSRTGNLLGILTGLSESEIVRKRIRRRLWLTISYPLLVTGLLLVIVCFMAATTVPVFAEIYQEFELELPVITQFTLAAADKIPLILLGSAVLSGVLLLLGVLVGKRTLHWLLGAVPIVGRVWTWGGQFEFATLMATLTGHAVPTDQALDCTIDSLRDQNLSRACRAASDKCAAGATLSQALHESIHFDPTLTLLVAWGERHDSLPSSLQEAADTIEQQMRLYSQFLQRVMPPALLTVISTTLFFLAASLLLPLIDLIHWLTG